MPPWTPKDFETNAGYKIFNFVPLVGTEDEEKIKIKPVVKTIDEGARVFIEF